jgi:hypothetical protein
MRTETTTTSSLASDMRHSLKPMFGDPALSKAAPCEADQGKVLKCRRKRALEFCFDQPINDSRRGSKVAAIKYKSRCQGAPIEAAAEREGV